MSQERIQELETELRRHSELYYNGMPEITDAEFDELVDELRELDPSSPALEEVGAAPAWGRKVKHPTLMGSLDKVNESSALSDWYEKLPHGSGPKPKRLLASPKVDGLAVRLRYVGGKLVEGATRGNGEIGQDVLENVKRIETIPHEVEDTFSGEVRGEVYMSKDVWKSFGGQFANPRNGAAGGLLQKDARETENRRLSFLAYGLKEEDCDRDNELECEYRAESLGFDYVKWEEVDPEHLEAFLFEWEANRRAKLPFQIDGLVFAVNSFDEQEEAGWSGKRPRGKMAWKFKPEQREASVMGVDWQVGRTGKLTPVLHIEPTHIDGSVISNISLASAARFRELALGRGDKVLVEKAGDIIPQVVRVTWKPLKSPRMEVPEECPCCGSRIVEDGAHIFCDDPNCAIQLQRRVLHWLNMHDIKGVGPGVAASMCGTIVKELSDLYYMKVEDLAKAIGSPKVAENVIQEIMLKSEMPLWRFLAGLGIPSLGKTASKAIAKKYATIEEILELQLPSTLTACDGIGKTTATQILSGLHAMEDDIMALERVIDIEESVTGGKLSGLTFCLTGAMSRNRKEIAADIEAVGGEVKSSVGKGLDFLVQSDPSSKSSKTQKAEKYGTKVISEEELMEMISA